MAGAGERFRRAGQACEKWQIEVLGRSLLEWSVVSLQAMFDSEFIFVTRAAHAADRKLKEAARRAGLYTDQVSIVSVDRLTRGQAESAMAASIRCRDDDSIMIYNIDTYVRPFAIRASDIRGAGWIPVFRAEGDRWSFVKTDERGRAIEVAEKNRISDLCSVGLYYFDSFGRFRALVEQRVADALEWYIAPLYQSLIDNGESVFVHELLTSNVFVFGTPEDLAVSTGRLLADPAACAATPARLVEQ